MDADGAAILAAKNGGAQLLLNNEAIRAVNVTDTAGLRHTVILNASEQTQSAEVDGGLIQLPPGGVVCFRKV